MHLKTRNVNSAFSAIVRILDGSANPGEAVGVDISKRPSRNGNVLMIDEPVTVTYTHPRERVLFNATRDANPFFHLYESLWMLAGRNDVEPLAYYAKQMREYSDDGKTLNGAYGYRWRSADITSRTKAGPRVDQLDIIVNHLKADPTSRRAVLQMWNVEDDLLKIGRTGAVLGENETYQMPSAFSKDVCCNLSVMFSLRHDHCPGCYEGGLTGEPDGYAVHIEHQEWGHYDRTEDYPRKPRCRLCKGSRKAPTALDMTVTNRSNDMVWGMLGANYVHFTFLQEYMAARLGAEVGRYHHFSNNLHVYDWNWKPDEWLSEDAVAGDLAYGHPQVKTVPLVKDPAVFDREVKEFVGAFNGQEEPLSCVPEYKEQFLDTVGKPMLKAFWYYKQKAMQSAIEQCQEIKADDWRIAATNWLQRRAKA